MFLQRLLTEDGLVVLDEKGIRKKGKIGVDWSCFEQVRLYKRFEENDPSLPQRMELLKQDVELWNYLEGARVSP